jgi:hypothetical protein
MLFRCSLSAAAAAAAPASVSVLSVVPDLPPVPEQDLATALGLVSEPDDRPARHGWPHRPADGRRRPNPQGRDWQYGGSRSS